MDALSHGYNDFKAHLDWFCPENGEFIHPGDRRRCSGWILSDYDTWHVCPGHHGRTEAKVFGSLAFGGGHPEDDLPEVRFVSVPVHGWGIDPWSDAAAADDNIPF